MDQQTLAFWRDISLIWLLLLPIVISAAVAFGFYLAYKYLRKVRPALRLPLLRVQVYALRVEQATTRASRKVVSVPIQVHAKAAQVRTTVQTLRNNP